MPTGLQQRLSLIISLSNRAALAGLTALRQGISGLQPVVGRVAKSMQAFGQQAESALRLASLAVGGLATGIGILAHRAANAAQTQQASLAGLRSIAESYGVSGAAAEAAAQQLVANTKGLLDVRSAAEGLKNLLGSKIGLDVASDAMMKFTETAIFNRQAHFGLAESVVKTTEGLRFQNNLLLDSIGIGENYNHMLERLKDERNLDLESLSESARNQVVVNELMQQASRSAGDMAKVLRMAQGQQLLFGAELLKVNQTIGEFVLQVKGAIFKAITPYLAALRTWIEGHRDLIQVKVSEWVQRITMALRQAIDVGIEYTKQIVSWIAENKSFLVEVGKAAGTLLLLVAVFGRLASPMAGMVLGLILLAAKSQVFRDIVEGFARILNEHRRLLLLAFGAVVIAQIVGNLASLVIAIQGVNTAMLVFRAAMILEGVSKLAAAALLRIAVGIEGVGGALGVLQVMGGPVLVLVTALAAAGTYLYLSWRKAKAQIDASNAVIAAMPTFLERDVMAIQKMIASLSALPKEQAITITVSGKDQLTTAGEHLNLLRMRLAEVQAAMAVPEAQQTPVQRQMVGAFTATGAAFTVTETPPVVTPGATDTPRVTDEQREAVQRLGVLQAQVHVDALTGMQKELAQIELNRMEKRQELTDLQAKAKTQIDLTQATADVEKIAQLEKQRLYEETTRKVDDLLTQVAETQASGVSAELVQIERVRAARQKEFGELLTDLTAMLPTAQEMVTTFERLRGQGGVIPLNLNVTDVTQVTMLIEQLQAKQIEIPVFLRVAQQAAQLKVQAPAITTQIDADAIQKKYQDLVNKTELLKIPAELGLTIEARLAGLETAKQELIAQITAMVPEIQQVFPTFDLDLTIKQVETAAVGLGDAERVKTVEAEKQQAIMTTMNLAIQAYRQGDMASANRYANEAKRLNDQLTQEQDLWAAIRHGELGLMHHRLRGWAEQSDTHAAIAAGMQVGWDQLMQGMTQIGTAFFEAHQVWGEQAEVVEQQLAKASQQYGVAVHANNVTAQAFYQAEIKRLTILQQQTLAFGRIATAVWKGFASAGLEAVAAVLKAMANIYAIKAAEAAISFRWWDVAKYTGLVAAASAGAGVLEGMAQQQQQQAMEALRPPDGGGGGQGGGGVGGTTQASGGLTQAAVAVQKEPTLYISPTIVFEAGHDIFIGGGSVEEFKADIGRVAVEAIQDAMATGQIRTGR